MSDPAVIRFHNAQAFSGLTGVVDPKEAVIHGVSLITGDVVAEGHDLKVDDETLTQLHSLAKKMGQVPVGLDHGSGISSINGYIDNFRVDGNQLRGDWHLLQTHTETPVMLERATKQPGTFGLSVAFKGKGVAVKPGGKAARAEKLLSADCVTRPAANPNGLFSARDTNPVDTDKIVDAAQAHNFNTMPDPNLNQNGEPTLADVLAELKGLGGRLEAMEQIQGQVVDHINSQIDGGNPLDGADPQLLSDLYNATPDELAAFNQRNGTNITVDQIDSAVNAYNASVDAGAQGQQQNGNQPGAQEGQTQGAAQGATAMAGAEGSASAGTAAFNALQREVIQLKAEIAREKALKAKEGEELQFAEIEGKMTVLAQQRDQAIELAQKLVAENEALQLCIKTGTRPVKAGVDNGVRLFSANENGELHEFQLRVKAITEEKKCSNGQAILFASRENPALHADWVQSQKRK